MEFPILSLLIFMPCISALVLSIGENMQLFGARSSRIIALTVSAVVFLLSLVLCFYINGETIQYVENINCISKYGVNYAIGIDGLSIYFVALTSFITLCCIYSTEVSINKQKTLYLSLLLILEGVVIGFFTSLDLVLFYIFFELSLIPTMLIIGIWGGENRIYASTKFFLYTFSFSLLMLLSILYIVSTHYTADITLLKQVIIKEPIHTQWFLCFGFLLPFMVKIPMWPLHTWLPEAHVQAPTGGSMMLAGVLLKMGGYGLYRIIIPSFPSFISILSFPMITLSIIGLIYTSLIALVQSDMKRLIAYSSISHMAYVTAGAFSNNVLGISGSIIQMISHGLVSAALFLLVGILYSKTSTREISKYSGLASKMPQWAVLFIFFTMSSIALPGTLGFIGEIMVLIGLFKKKIIYSILMSVGMVLGPCYMLALVAKIAFGCPNDLAQITTDIERKNHRILIIIAIIVLLLGLQPMILLRTIEEVPIIKSLTND